MTVGAVAGTHPAVSMLTEARELARKAEAMLAPDEVWTLSDADVDQVLRAQSALDSASAAVGVRAVREADVRGLAAADGKVSTAIWLAKKLDLHPGEAHARVRAADLLSRKGAATMEALAAGRVNPDQARAIARGLSKVEPVASAEEFGDAEALLLREGIGLHAGQITRLARHIEAVLDADGTEPAGDPDDGDDPAASPQERRADRTRRKRALTITNLGNGLHRITGDLTDEVAALMKAALDPLAAPRPAVNGVRDERSAPQRRHDALGDVFRQFLRFGKNPTGHGVRPHVHLTATVETLAGDGGHPFARTATGEDLDLATLRRFACDAGITPILADTLGVPLAMGREVRTATPAQWAALVARDIGCIGEGCTRPASWCEAHHIRWWEHGGDTDLENLALVCSHEHYLIHHQGWQVQMAEDGHPEMIPPKWVDPEQRPRRNAHWKLLRDGLKQPAPESDDPDRGP